MTNEGIKFGNSYIEYNPVNDASGKTFHEELNEEAYHELFKPVKSGELSKEALLEMFEHVAPTANDNVNHPSHYTRGSIECIDAIEASMPPAEFRGAMKANIIKYLWRYEHKNGLEDLKKARFYLERMIASYEKDIGKEST